MENKDRMFTGDLYLPMMPPSQRNRMLVWNCSIHSTRLAPLSKKSEISF